MLGLITLPGGRPTGDGALTPGVAVVERSRTTTPERRGPILTAPTRQPRLQPWPCLCRCEYLRQCTASVRSSASAACRIPAGALMVIELAGDVVRKITRPTLAVIVSKSGRMSSSWKPPPAATSIACFVFRLVQRLPSVLALYVGAGYLRLRQIGVFSLLRRPNPWRCGAENRQCPIAELVDVASRWRNSAPTRR